MRMNAFVNIWMSIDCTYACVLRDWLLLIIGSFKGTGIHIVYKCT